ncbi:MAG: AtpZ/AtpI family protein [Bacteroidota bacterium]
MGKNPKGLRNWAVFSGIGLQMGLIIYLGNLLGIWLDGKLSTTFLEATITVIAVFGAMFSVIYRLNKFNARNK